MSSDALIEALLFVKYYAISTEASIEASIVGLFLDFSVSRGGIFRLC